MTTFICPFCGKTEVGPADWKRWCACQPVVTTVLADEVRYERPLVEMVACR